MKVLIICSLFPPGGGPGAKRISQFVKYLVPLQWTPLVLTHKNYFMGYDKQSLNKIPPMVKIYRTRSLEQYIRNVPNGSTKTNYTTNLKSKNKNILFRFLKYIFKNFMPDTGILWMPFALWEAKKIYKTTSFDVIFATGSLFSNFLTGTILKKITKRPLILDFRDAWAANPDLDKGTTFQRYMANFYEKISILNASFIIATTKGVKQDFLRRYKFLDKNKFIVIPNGYDTDDLVTADHKNIQLDKAKFNVVHTGTLSGIRNPKFFFQSISELINEKKIDSKLLRLYMVGLSSIFDDGFTIEDYIKTYNIFEYTQLTGFVSRLEAFEYNAKANLLLLIIGINPTERLETYGLSGKVYDYILTQKPIFALAQKGGATYNFLTENKIGVIANPTDKDDIKEKFLKIYIDWLKGQLTGNYDRAMLKKYDMKDLTKYLSEIFHASLSQNE